MLRPKSRAPAASFGDFGHKLHSDIGGLLGSRRGITLAGARAEITAHQEKLSRYPGSARNLALDKQGPEWHADLLAAQLRFPTDGKGRPLLNEPARARREDASVLINMVLNETIQPGYGTDGIRKFLARLRENGILDRLK